MPVVAFVITVWSRAKMEVLLVHVSCKPSGLLQNLTIYYQFPSGRAVYNEIC